MSNEKSTEQQPAAASGEALSDESLEAVSGGLSLIGTLPGGMIPAQPLPAPLTLPTEPLVNPIPTDSPTIAIVVE